MLTKGTVTESRRIVCFVARERGHGYAVAQAIAHWLPDEQVAIFGPGAADKITDEDLVVCLSWPLVFAAPKRARKILYLDNPWPMASKAPGGYFNEACQASRAIVAPTEDMARLARSQFDGASLPIWIIEPAVPAMTPATFPEGDFRVIWIGDSAGARYRAGDEAAGRSMIAEAAGRAKVNFIEIDAACGRSMRCEQIADNIQAAHALAVGSLTSGGPIVALEALACGRPVIMPRVGLATKILQQGVTGCIVDRSVAGYRAAIEYWRSVIARNGDEAHRVIRRFARAHTAGAPFALRWQNVLCWLSTQWS